MVLSLQASFPKNTWRSTRYSIKPCTENCLTSNRVTGQEQPEKDIRTSNKLGKDGDSEVHPIKKLQASNFGQHIFAVPVLCGQIPRLDQHLQCSDCGSQEIWWNTAMNHYRPRKRSSRSCHTFAKAYISEKAIEVELWSSSLRSSKAREKSSLALSSPSSLVEVVRIVDWCEISRCPLDTLPPLPLLLDASIWGGEDGNSRLSNRVLFLGRCSVWLSTFWMGLGVPKQWSKTLQRVTVESLTHWHLSQVPSRCTSYGDCDNCDMAGVSENLLARS